ncbi:MAG TPA: molybdopterin-dependent oxidoreductase [Candidatus Dormibacteraeota bacterium]|nr:molybdopterin-dependent oxidoreductase [Candidatus Dormibacteraeota bacterium]
MAVLVQRRYGGSDLGDLGKHRELIVHSQDPFNAEPPLRLLGREFITPTDLFYVRDHGTVPEIDPGRFRLQVDGLVRDGLELSLEDLRSRFPSRTVSATLQCAGNRRRELMDIEPIPDEVAWREGVIGTARWTGVLLRDVLKAAGVRDGAAHVAFAGLDQVEKDSRRFGFGGSIPLSKALGDETLLAWEMNGQPIPPLHGFPLRAVVPGYIGARSVKWLESIRVQHEPSDNYFQQRDYRLFPRQVRPHAVDRDQGLMLGELSVNAVICSPGDGDTVAAGPVAVEGYATAGGPRWVARVDVSVDDGQSWTGAELLGPDEPGAWRLWRAELNLEEGERQIVARALDSSANIQPDQPGPLWNFRGYVNNAWHRVTITGV